MDLVISDVKMPNMDGLTLLTTLRAQAPDLPVILLSGHGDEEVGRRARQLGARDYLQKPVSAKALVATIERVRG